MEPALHGPQLPEMGRGGGVNELRSRKLPDLNEKRLQDIPRAQATSIEPTDQ